MIGELTSAATQWMIRRTALLINLAASALTLIMVYDLTHSSERPSRTISTMAAWSGLQTGWIDFWQGWAFAEGRQTVLSSIVWNVLLFALLVGGVEASRSVSRAFNAPWIATMALSVVVLVELDGVGVLWWIAGLILTASVVVGIKNRDVQIGSVYLAAWALLMLLPALVLFSALSYRHRKRPTESPG